MFPQSLEDLGFSEDENKEVPPRGYRQIKQQQKDGFLPGKTIWAGKI